MIRKAPSLELADVRPDMLALAAISSEVDEPAIREKLVKKPEVLDKLRARSFSAPSLQGQRLAYKFDDKQSLELIPEAIPKSEPQRISEPAKPNRKFAAARSNRRWFSGPTLPGWLTRWYDNWMGTPEKPHPGRLVDAHLRRPAVGRVADTQAVEAGVGVDLSFEFRVQHPKLETRNLGTTGRSYA